MKLKKEDKVVTKNYNRFFDGTPCDVLEIKQKTAIIRISSEYSLGEKPIEVDLKYLIKY
jgi:hypothetical protein